MKYTILNQKAFAPILIIIGLALIVVTGAIVYGYFISKGASPKKDVIPVSENRSSPLPQLGTPGCEDVDYTGCDTSADFMTWKDTGERNPPSQ